MAVTSAWVEDLFMDWLASHTFKAMLVTSAYVSNPDDATLPASEVSGTGYTAGGIDVTGAGVVYDSDNNTVRITCDDLDFGTVDLADVGGVVFHDTTQVITSDIFDPVEVDSRNFTYHPPTTGIVAAVLGAAGTSITTSGRMFGDPGLGNMYFGTSTLVTGRETFMGQRMGVHRTFWNNASSGSQGTPNAIAKATSDIAAGRVPWISFKLNSPSLSWAQFAAGSGDTWFGSLLTSLDAIGGGPILLTLHHEPNGDGSPAADYLAMYRHAKTMTDAYPQILLTPVLSAGYWQVVGGGGLICSQWMQADSCDVFGLDIYNQWSPDNGKAFITVDQAFRQGGFDACNAIDSTKPIAVAEWGVRAEPAHAGRAATWMSDAFEYVRNNNGVAMAFFDSGINSPDGNWTLDTDANGDPETERLDEFQTLLTGAHSVLIPTGGIAP